MPSNQKCHLQSQVAFFFDVIVISKSAANKIKLLRIDFDAFYRNAHTVFSFINVAMTTYIFNLCNSKRTID